MEKKPSRTFSAQLPAKSFCLSFRLTNPSDGKLLMSQPWLEADYDAGMLVIRLLCQWHNAYRNVTKDYVFTLKARLPSEGSHDVRLCWLDHVTRLYLGGVLQDEEYPLGQLRAESKDIEITAAPGVSELAVTDTVSLQEEEEQSFTGPMQFFLPPGLETGVGDCMPFARDGRYCLYYLLDRRGHKSKAGLGAHQWAQISSADLKEWVIHPMAVQITKQWEGSICTGSLLSAFGRVYAFYAVRMSDQSPARITWAVSEDGVHFEKSGQYFALSAPYEPVSARDPMVFRGEEGLYHMLVTTNLVGPDAPQYPGCLAHLEGPDLIHWTQRDPFIVPGYPDQPECSDYFQWNDCYYLVFSNGATARYRYSASPFGPWIKPEQDILDTRDGQVAKTAAFGNRRFSSSFLTTYPRSYAGYAITHELIQHPDGTLGAKFLEEILPPEQDTLYSDHATVSAPEGRAVLTLGKGQNIRLRGRLKASNAAMRLGVQITDEAGKAYHIDINPAQMRMSVSRPGQDFTLLEGRNQLLGVRGLQDEFSIDLLYYEEALDISICEDRVFTLRAPREGRITIDLYALWGTLSAKSLRLTELQARG